MCKIDSLWEHALKPGKFNLVLCDDLDGWDEGEVGGRPKKKGIFAYIQLIHFAVLQNLTQQCKEIILQN